MVPWENCSNQFHIESNILFGNKTANVLFEIHVGGQQCTGMTYVAIKKTKVDKLDTSSSDKSYAQKNLKGDNFLMFFT